MKIFNILCLALILLCLPTGCRKKSPGSGPSMQELYGPLNKEETLTDERKLYLLNEINRYKDVVPSEKVELLSELGTNIEGVDKLYLVLSEVIKSQDKELLDALEASKISLKGKRAKLVFYGVLTRGDIDAADYLIKQGILDDTKIDNLTLFRAACAEKNRPELIRLLVKTGAYDINNCKSEGSSLFHWVVFKGYLDSVETLISLGADVNLKDDFYKHTALHVAARYGYYEIAKVLLENGADYRIKDEIGKTALDKALEPTEFGRESFFGKRKVAALIREYMKKDTKAQRE